MLNESFVLNQFKTHEGYFFYGIEFDGFWAWFPSWNLSNPNSDRPRLFSPDFVALTEMARGIEIRHTSLRDVAIANLKEGVGGTGMITPRATVLVVAARIEKGQLEGMGADILRWVKKDKDNILKAAKVELRFEEVRRKIAPDAASRLCCLYVAENNKAGRNLIRYMLGNNVKILRVRIPTYIRLTKADPKWFERYWNEKHDEYINKYWEGEPSGSNAPAWEYLVEGMIEVDDLKMMKTIRQAGPHRKYLTKKGK